MADRSAPDWVLSQPARELFSILGSGGKKPPGVQWAKAATELVDRGLAKRSGRKVSLTPAGQFAWSRA